MANDEFVDIETGEVSGLPAAFEGGSSLLEIAERAEKSVQAVKRIKAAALSVTNEHDWVNENGKPYLQSSGAEKIAALFGISWRIQPPVKSDEGEGHYRFTYTGDFSLPGRAPITCIGARSTRDPFFTRYDKSRKDENGEPMKIKLPPSEIDSGDVQKAAYTNLIQGGIKRLLGLRNLTWDEVKGSGASDQTKSANVERKSGADDSARKAWTITEPQQKRFFAIAKKSGLTDDQIHDYLYTEFGISSSREIKYGSDYEKACAWAERGGK